MVPIQTHPYRIQPSKRPSVPTPPRQRDGKGHPEDDRSRPRLGRHKRTNAPRRTHLGPNPQILPSSRRNPPPVPLLPQEMAQPPPNLAVLRPFPPQPIGLRRFLRHPQRRAHLDSRSGDQRDDVRRHRRVRDGAGGGDPCWVGFVWYIPYRSWCLHLYHVIGIRGSLDVLL